MIPDTERFGADAARALLVTSTADDTCFRSFMAFLAKDLKKKKPGVNAQSSIYGSRPYIGPPLFTISQFHANEGQEDWNIYRLSYMILTF